MRSIGMIGIGMMGHGIATNLLRHGYPLMVLEHPGNQPLDKLLGAGATSTPDLKALVARAEVLLLCVTGSPQIEALMLGDQGIAATMKRGTIVIDCSTAIPSSTVRVAKAVANAGGRFLDAPMTRTPREAALGKLNLIVGGDKDLFEACLPILQSFAENIVHGGGVGAGHQLKLLHNFVSLGFSAILAETVACAVKGGVDPKVLMEILAKGAGGGVVFERIRPYVDAGDASGLQFAMVNGLKDVTYYNDMAREQGAAHAAAETIRGIYADAAKADPQQPIPTLIDFLAGTPRK
ncbi:MAG: NAD(P)-dependent oxidoreductase [Burkholderiaceae bacterium]